MEHISFTYISWYRQLYRTVLADAQSHILDHVNGSSMRAYRHRSPDLLKCLAFYDRTHRLVTFRQLYQIVNFLGNCVPPCHFVGLRGNCTYCEPLVRVGDIAYMEGHEWGKLSVRACYSTSQYGGPSLRLVALSMLECYVICCPANLDTVGRPGIAMASDFSH